MSTWNANWPPYIPVRSDQPSGMRSSFDPPFIIQAFWFCATAADWISMYATAKSSAESSSGRTILDFWTNALIAAEE